MYLDQNIPIVYGTLDQEALAASDLTQSLLSDILALQTEGSSQSRKFQPI
jgi:hypothetical protein